jgi:hypothetical protein
MSADVLCDRLLIHQGQLHSSTKYPCLFRNGEFAIAAGWWNLRFRWYLLQYKALQSALLYRARTYGLALDVNILSSGNGTEHHGHARNNLTRRV